jgi:hypothetical protein
MARWNFHQRIAVFYIYLVTFLLAEPIVQSPHARRGIFGDLTPVKYDTNGQPIVQDIVKRSEPRLEVSNHIQNQLGEWHNVRSLGGPMAMKWLSLHGEGHPNTTVMWSNGTHVAPHQVHEIIHLAKRWGWADAAIELTLWGARAVTITNAGLIAGFAAVVVVGLIGYAGYALAHAINPGTTIESGNNQKRNQLANGMEKRNNFEPNVFYRQLVGNQADTGQWPSTADMQNAVHSSLQDMADHDCEFP